jgi:hypothetical protein
MTQVLTLVASVAISLEVMTQVIAMELMLFPLRHGTHSTSH